MMTELPNDPVLMLGVVNTKLRDYYSNLDILCEEMQVEKEKIVE